MSLVRYPLDQQTALNENLAHIEKAKPNAIMIAGDLAQGAGFQPALEEFWLHFAVNLPISLPSPPLLAALGNWETYFSLNGGYGSECGPYTSRHFT